MRTARIAIVFLALLGGFDAFGPVGLLLGPLMMTAFLTLVTIYREHYLPLTVKGASPPGPIEPTGA